MRTKCEKLAEKESGTAEHGKSSGMEYFLFTEREEEIEERGEKEGKDYF